MSDRADVVVLWVRYPPGKLLAWLLKETPVVWATVMSRPTDDRAIVDAGLKALSVDSGMPTVWEEPAATHGRRSGPGTAPCPACGSRTGSWTA